MPRIYSNYKQGVFANGGALSWKQQQHTNRDTQSRRKGLVMEATAGALLRRQHNQGSSTWSRSRRSRSRRARKLRRQHKQGSSRSRRTGELQIQVIDRRAGELK